jgi:hypothetical protein
VQELVGVILSAKVDDERRVKSKATIEVFTTIFVMCGSPQSDSGLFPIRLSVKAGRSEALEYAYPE